MIALECIRPGFNGEPGTRYGAILDEEKGAWISLQFDSAREAQDFMSSCEAAGINLASYRDATSTLLPQYLHLWRHAFSTGVSLETTKKISGQ